MLDQLRALKWDLCGDYLLAVFGTSQDNEAIRQHMMALLATKMGAVCLGYQGNTIAIINNSSARIERITSQLRQIARDFNRVVAVSERFIDFPKIGTYHDQARFALGMAQR
jgi:hypothetical protein